jgi:predicted dinucleotide-binding enzyme
MNRVLTVLLLFTSILMCPTNVMSDDLETVAIIGTGDLGDSFGPRLAKLGYKVVYGSRTPDSDKVRALVVATGNGATASSQKEAAQRGDIVMLAVPWPAMETVAQNLGNLDGKIVIDVSFPWTQADDGYAEILVQTSSAEMIQAWNPGAKVVKGLTTMGSKIIDDPMAAGGIITIPLASNHRDAKERVAAIVVELGLDPVDVGPLRMARAMEAMGLIYMTPLLQRRTEEWEFFFRRNADWVCRWQDDWSVPVYDADHLAEMPETQDPPKPCP